MDEKQQELFYVGAVIYLNLDSTEVDNMLNNAGLSVENNSVAECREVIRKHFPERYEFVCGMRPT